MVRIPGLAIALCCIGAGLAYGQALDPAPPPPPDGPSGSVDPWPGIETDAGSAPAGAAATAISQLELEEIQAMCSQRADWEAISVCVRLRPPR